MPLFLYCPLNIDPNALGTPDIVTISGRKPISYAERHTSPGARSLCLNQSCTFVSQNSPFLYLDYLAMRELPAKVLGSWNSPARPVGSEGGQVGLKAPNNFENNGTTS